jgi:hypothetical protein
MVTSVLYTPDTKQTKKNKMQHISTYAGIRRGQCNVTNTEAFLTFTRPSYWYSKYFGACSYKVNSYNRKGEKKVATSG